MRLRYIQTADGKELIRLRSIKSAYLRTFNGNGFEACQIRAILRSGGEVTLAAYTALADTPEASSLADRAQADFDRLGQLLNGARLAKGEKWPKEVQT